MRKIRISIYNIKPGMIAAGDVYSSSGQLLVPSGATFTPATLDRLNSYSVPFVTVFDDEKPVTEPEHIPLPKDASYSARIKDSDEFKKFQDEFNTSLGDVNQSLQHIVTSGTDIDVDDLLDQTTHLLAHASTTIGILDLVNNLRSYDDSTYAHSLNVSIICRVFGQWLNMSSEELDRLTVAGTLHDLGKLLIPPEIIKKPGRLTDEEFAIIKRHPSLGYEHVKDAPLSDDIKMAILMHHEKCDGSGYPSNLTMNQIHPFGRIVAIADVYDAMTAKRVYRDGICPFHVIRMFESEGYQTFDVQYLLPFLRGIVQTYMNNRVRLTDGSVGEIIMINNNALSKPFVKVGDQFINLATTSDLSIEEIL